MSENDCEPDQPIWCKYYPNSLCLTDGRIVCNAVYNRWNKTCPYYALYLKEKEVK